MLRPNNSAVLSNNDSATGTPGLWYGEKNHNLRHPLDMLSRRNYKGNLLQKYIKMYQLYIGLNPENAAKDSREGQIVRFQNVEEGLIL